MPRQISKRERLLRERWPKWEFTVTEVGPCRPFKASAWIPVPRKHSVVIWGRYCTRRSAAWRSLERAMVRTARALEESGEARDRLKRAERRCLRLEATVRKERKRGENLARWLRQCKVYARRDANTVTDMAAIPLDEIPGYVSDQAADLECDLAQVLKALEEKP